MVAPRSSSGHSLPGPHSDPFRDSLLLLLASAAALYFELLTIRYLATEVRVFTNLKNLPLVASFFGIGLGMILGGPGKRLRAAFPLVALIFFSVIRYAGLLHLPSTDVSWTYGLSQGNVLGWTSRIVYALRFVGLVLGLCALIVVLFVVLGGFIGERLKRVRPLHAYGLNLGGSLVGVLLFSGLAVLNLGPAIWLLVGFVLLLAFFQEVLPIILFLITIGVVAVPQPDTLWSPYYRIDFRPVPESAGSAYSVVTNHVWYQWLADLSPGFLEDHPTAEPNRFLVPYYELPYRLVPQPRNVLVLGAGTGNDVAAALRHGAKHVDAVELDPVILELGRQYHPERPYNSTRVSTHVDDARAFLRNTRNKYDLVIFAFLDSTTLSSGFSSLRLDNYVYTVGSFKNAKDALSPDGTLILSFATGRNFATNRLYASMRQAFGVAPAAYFTRYWVNGVLLVEGVGREVHIPELVSASSELRSAQDVILATDAWPFLYLQNRSIPGSILVVAGLFLLGAWAVLRKLGIIHGGASPQHLHFFCLGAGFLLLETKAVTQMSLLFGSTWVVNAVVISSFLLMAILANVVVAFAGVQRIYSYGLLLALLIADFWFPYSRLAGAAEWARIVLGGVWISLPILFSGVIFSIGLRDFGNPGAVLGVNLLGAVVGGILENSVMVGGTPILGFLATVSYVGSAVILFRSTARASIPLTSHVL